MSFSNKWHMAQLVVLQYRMKLCAASCVTGDRPGVAGGQGQPAAPAQVTDCGGGSLPQVIPHRPGEGDLDPASSAEEPAV